MRAVVFSARAVDALATGSAARPAGDSGAGLTSLVTAAATGTGALGVTPEVFPGWAPVDPGVCEATEGVVVDDMAAATLGAGAKGLAVSGTDDGAGSRAGDGLGAAGAAGDAPLPGGEVAAARVAFSTTIGGRVQSRTYGTATAEITPRAATPTTTRNHKAAKILRGSSAANSSSESSVKRSFIIRRHTMRKSIHACARS
jgi:hypothetical protein